MIAYKHPGMTLEGLKLTNRTTYYFCRGE